MVWLTVLTVINFLILVYTVGMMYSVQARLVELHGPANPDIPSIVEPVPVDRVPIDNPFKLRDRVIAHEGFYASPPQAGVVVGLEGTPPHSALVNFDLLTEIRSVPLQHLRLETGNQDGNSGWIGPDDSRLNPRAQPRPTGSVGSSGPGEDDPQPLGSTGTDQ